MALTSNNNVTPRKTMTGEDIAAVVRETMGKVRAEEIVEDRERALALLDDPDAMAAAKAAAARKTKAANMANAAAGGSAGGNTYRRGYDPLADKSIDEMTRHERALMFARSIQCMVQGRALGNGMQSIIDVAERAGQTTLVKAFQATDFNQGGFLLEPAFADAVVPELLAKVIYAGGPTEVDLPEGGFTQPFEEDGADAQWIGEGVAANAEEVTGGQINMTPHKLLTIVGMSNDMLRAPVGRSAEFILGSMTRGMGVKLDSTLIRGVGSSNEPNGLRGLVQTANKFDVTSGTSITQAVLVRELLKLQDLLEGGDVNISTGRPLYMTSSRIKNFLKAQRATTGVLFPGLSISPGPDNEGTLLGVPLRTTSNIPITLDESGTAANDESELYCVALAMMMLGKTEDMLVDIAPGAAYTNSSGSTVAAFSRDETPIRVISKWDHADLQRGKSVALAQELDWAL